MPDPPGRRRRSVAMNAMPAVTMVYDDVFLDHRESGHWERPERVQAIANRLRADERLAGIPWSDADGAVAGPALLGSVHAGAHVRSIEMLAAAGGGWIDPDTYCTPRSFNVAARAAGATAWAAALVCDGGSRHAFALVRPPGHHATTGRAMGFCLFNNVAIAARAMRDRHGVARVAVIDIDAHHGNGTQEIFSADPTVFYASLHEYPWYPGTGAASEIGTGEGRGSTLNVPLPSHTTAAEWLGAFTDHIEPAVERFGPNVILVSAGFDAHRDDPLASLDLDAATYGEVARSIRNLAAGAGIPTLWVLEGGYDLTAIADSASEVVRALAEEEVPCDS